MLFLVEVEAESHSQIKLISQGIINYLDISDSAEKSDEYLTKLIVQLEELEGKFIEFNEFLEKISETRLTLLLNRKSSIKRIQKCDGFRIVHP